MAAKLVTALILVLLPLSLDGQGMVPLSEVIDHSPVPKGKPLSQEKVKAHKSIAAQHLETQQSNQETKEQSKVSVEDKPQSLQNPDKHRADDDFILPFLLSQYPRSQSVEERLEILQNLENYSHKFENGRDLFKSTNALADILLPALNSSEAEVRSGACRVLAIAAQNNQEVQKAAVEAGVTRPLVALLIGDDGGLRNKAIGALSALVRNYPDGQSALVKDGGLQALVKVAGSSETRKRALNLVTDLLQERKHCGMDDTPCDNKLELQRIQKTLTIAGWCDVLSDVVEGIPGFDTDDQLLSAEAAGESMSFCFPKLAKFSPIFGQLLKKLEDEEERESSDDAVVNQYDAEGIRLVRSLLVEIRKRKMERIEL